MKELSIPQKIWLDVGEFLRDFPFLRASLILTKIIPDPRSGEITPGLPITAANELGGTGRGFLTGLSAWDLNRKMQTYRDNIRFAISPEIPIEVELEPDQVQMFGAPNMIAYTIPGTVWQKYRTQMGYMAMSVGPIPGVLYDLVANDYLTPPPLVNSNPTLKTWMGLYRSGPKGMTENLLIKRGVKHFRATTPPVYKQFDEIYGETDLKKVPPFTISYAVVGKAPPLPDEYKDADWQSAAFWSSVFNSDFGQAILNAVARNLPVAVKTPVTNWKNLDQPDYKLIENEDIRRHIFTYVWQDFNISIGPNFNILVKYSRSADTVEILQRKKDAWKHVLLSVGIVAAAVGAALLLAPGGAVGAGATAGVEAGAAGTVEAGAAAATEVVLGGTGAIGAGGAGATGAGATGAVAGAGVAGGAGILSSIGSAAGTVISKVGGAITTGLGILVGAEQYKQLKEGGGTPQYTTAGDLQDDYSWLGVLLAAGLVGFIGIKLLKGKGS